MLVMVLRDPNCIVVVRNTQRACAALKLLSKGIPQVLAAPYKDEFARSFSHAQSIGSVGLRQSFDRLQHIKIATIGRSTIWCLQYAAGSSSLHCADLNGESPF